MYGLCVTKKIVMIKVFMIHYYVQCYTSNHYKSKKIQTG